MTKYRTWMSALLPFAMVLLLACSAEACPTCKDGLAEESNVAQGYFWSILFMMSMPFLILGTLSSLFYLEIRRARQQQQTQASVSTGASEALELVEN